MATQILKWDDPEYRREYYRKYYHAHKVHKNIKRDIDWTDHEAVKEFKREYYKEKREKLGKYICDVCRIEVIKINQHRHERTQRHKNGLVLLEKLSLLSQQ